MDIHKNARLTLIRREQLAQAVLVQKMPLQAAARSFHVCARTAAKWTHRYQKEGLLGLHDRSSRPHRSPRRTGEALAEHVEQLRRQRFTGYHIAQATGLSRATVSRILRRLGLNRMRDLEPAVPLIRYEHPAPGDLLHLDIKQLGRFAGVVSRPDGRRRGSLHRGWEYVHVAIDDHSRIAFTQILPRFDAACAIAFLRASLAYYASLGIVIRRLLTDNGHCYRSRAFHAAVVESWVAPSLHSSLHATHQRQSRTLHSNRPAGMGLRPLVSRLSPPSGTSSSLASLLQLAPSSW